MDILMGMYALICRKKKNSTKTENRIRCKSLSKTFVLDCISFQGSCNLNTTNHYERALFCFVTKSSLARLGPWRRPK